MAYHLMKVCLGLVDIVEAPLLVPFGYEGLAVEIADSIPLARSLAQQSGYIVRHEIQVVKDLTLYEAKELIQSAVKKGVPEIRAMEAALKLMSKDAKHQFLS